jgi:hypothetical protein
VRHTAHLDAFGACWCTCTVCRSATNICTCPYCIECNGDAAKCQTCHGKPPVDPLITYNPGVIGSYEAAVQKAQQAPCPGCGACG